LLKEILPHFNLVIFLDLSTNKALKLFTMENATGSVTPLPHNQLGIQVVSAASAGAFIDMVVISLRLWSRKLKKRGLTIGDYLIIVAWVGALLPRLLHQAAVGLWGSYFII
jgi:hypothetical protein